MKITLELPDSTQAAVINYICYEHGEMLLVSKCIGTKDIESGYKDCREYEVRNDSANLIPSCANT